MPDYGKIPRPTVKHLSLYLRELESLDEADRQTINSRQLGNSLGLTDAQVRKDLAYFGQFGHPGIGYQVAELIAELRRILGTDRSWPVLVVGAGNIGRAVMRYGRLSKKGFNIVAVCDRDPELLDRVIDGHRVLPISALPDAVHEHGVRIGLLAVPAESAQEVADAMIKAGICGILNFAPRRISVGESVAIVSVDLTVSLEQLAFKMALGVTGSHDDSPAGHS